MNAQHHPFCLCSKCIIQPLRSKHASQENRQVSFAESSGACPPSPALDGGGDCGGGRHVASGHVARAQAYEPTRPSTVEGGAQARSVAVSLISEPRECLSCGTGFMSPHRADWRLEKHGKLLAYACDTALPAILLRVLSLALLLVVGCSDASRPSGALANDAGERERDGWIVGLLDGAEPELDASEPNDAGSDASDASEPELDASEPHDAGSDANDASEPEQCIDSDHVSFCRGASCDVLCRVGTNLKCCERADGGSPLCACEVAP
jgi:hypothetical protein